MEWNETINFETARHSAEVQQTRAEESMEVHSAQGISLLYTPIVSCHETGAALKLLKGFRATGRRVVLCDTSHIIAGRQLGGEIVAEGAATMLVSSGLSGREVGIGARDAGLDLANVVVCRDTLTAGEVLTNRLAPGDSVLLVGVDREIRDQLLERITDHFAQAQPLRLAA